MRNGRAYYGIIISQNRVRVTIRIKGKNIRLLKRKMRKIMYGKFRPRARKKDPIKKVPEKKEPVKKVPEKKIPVKKEPVKKIPEKKEPVKKETLKKIPEKKEPVKKIPESELPVHEPEVEDAGRTLRSFLGAFNLGVSVEYYLPSHTRVEMKKTTLPGTVNAVGRNVQHKNRMGVSFFYEQELKNPFFFIRMDLGAIKRAYRLQTNSVLNIFDWTNALIPAIKGTEVNFRPTIGFKYALSKDWKFKATAYYGASILRVDASFLLPLFTAGDLAAPPTSYSDLIDFRPYRIHNPEMFGFGLKLELQYQRYSIWISRINRKGGDGQSEWESNDLIFGVGVAF